MADYSVDLVWLTFRDAALQRAYLNFQHDACHESHENLLLIGVALVGLATVVAGVAKYGGVFFLQPEYWERCDPSVASSD